MSVGRGRALSAALSVAKVIGRGILSLAGAVTLVFLSLRLAPGDPADNILGADAPAAAKTAFRERLLLDLPLVDQYGVLWSNLARGDLGVSYAAAERPIPVSRLVAEALPATLELALAALLIAAFIAVPLGTLSARFQHGPVDVATLAFAMFGAAVPVFWSGPLLLYLFAVRLDVSPDPGDPLRGLAPLVLPAAARGSALAARLVRTVRASVLDVLRLDFVTLARAKGLPESRVLFRHVLRNAWIPVVTVMGLQLAALLSGAIVTEKVFARPGLGTLLLDGIARRDYAVVQGCVLVGTLAWVLVNAGLELLYLALDPRVRTGAPR